MKKSEFRGNYIAGHFERSNDPNGTIPSIDPGDLDRPAISCEYNFESIPRAVDAAKDRFNTWRRMSLADRCAWLDRYREVLVKRADELARQITSETGRPLWESKIEVEQTSELIGTLLKTSSRYQQGESIEEAAEATRGTVAFRPRGAFAVIAPGILPLLDAHAHWVPATLAGNTVVLKASRHAPLLGQMMAEMSHDSGLPAGLFNLVHGESEVSNRLISEAGLDGILFTGSYETGLKIRKQTLSDFQKHVVLDMVGKNSALLWNDCNYEQALHESLLAAFLTTGQRRHTTNRILIHHEIFDRFVQDFHRLAKLCKVSHGMNDTAEAPFMGPLLSEAALENYVRYQGIAVREGCEEIMRGKPLERSQKGFYVAPSIHRVAKADARSVYQRSEIFGPNVALYRVQDLEEAIDIINLPQHGLVASIYTKSQAVFEKAFEQVMVGTLHWNRPTIAVSRQIPTVGLKKSGNGRPMGSWAPFQCMYPITALEFHGTFKLAKLPAVMPRLG